ncbi:MAG: hypothetical protein IJK46_06010 [Prevotella sp.]|nr:hypothetical protein [Prevotella sp.]
MKTTSVAIVNGISLQVVQDEREQLVAVKPVCEILGVDFSAQRAKLKEHPIFGSTMVLSTTVGADGKEREMVCIHYDEELYRDGTLRAKCYQKNRLPEKV